MRLPILFSVLLASTVASFAASTGVGSSRKLGSSSEVVFWSGSLFMVVSGRTGS